MRSYLRKAFESKNVEIRKNKGKSQVMNTFLPYIACWINRMTFYFSPKSVLKILNLFQVIGSLDHTCVFFGFRLTTLHPRLPSSICPFCPWTDIGPLHHPWDIWGKGKIRYGVSWKIDWINQSVFESKTSFVKAFKNPLNLPIHKGIFSLSFAF